MISYIPLKINKKENDQNKKNTGSTSKSPSIVNKLTQPDIQIKVHKYCNKLIYEMDNFLTHDECKVIGEYMINKGVVQNTIEDIKFIDLMWEKIESRLPKVVEHNNKKYKIVGLENKITITNCKNPVNCHIDIKFKETHLYKLGIYINKLSSDGGTVFCSITGNGPNNLTINNEIGKAVLFDISLAHKGAPIPKDEKKLMIGFRPIFEQM